MCLCLFQRFFFIFWKGLVVPVLCVGSGTATFPRAAGAVSETPATRSALEGLRAFRMKA